MKNSETKKTIILVILIVMLISYIYWLKTGYEESLLQIIEA